MAHGEIHHSYLRRNWIAILPIGLILYLLVLHSAHSYLYPILFYINYLLCEIIDPDNDQLSLTMSEGIVLRSTRKVWLGFLGALFVAYSFLYSYIIGLFGGHRSWLSHGWFTGTAFRMVFYNIPLFIVIWIFYSYGMLNWGWAENNIPVKYFLYMDVWVKPYLITQALAWFYGDGVHLILDTEWAKYRLYEPIKSKR
jgi:hypothetical protein